MSKTDTKSLPIKSKEKAHDEYFRKLERVELLEHRLKLKEGLPFLYGWKWYTWAREFFESTNKMTFLVAANQISKSSTQIRKCIHWATSQKDWPNLWRKKPLQFWYLYPTKEVATIEFEKKWVTEFLPRNEFKTHPVYGWEEEYKNKSIFALHFNSGVSVYFKTYAQDVQHLQSGTVDAIFCFVAGTKVSTPLGLKNIEELRVGDEVLTHAGVRKIVRTMVKQAPVITRHIGDTEITATPDHPFWTQNRGWVQFGSLTKEDECVQHTQWQNTKSLDTLIQFYLKERSTQDGWIAPTLEPEAILEILQGLFFMWQFGKPTIKEKSEKILLSIIKTLTPWTINSQTYSFSLEQRIQDFIKNMSGKSVDFILSNVCFAEKSFFLEVVKNKYRDFVAWFVEENLTPSSFIVSSVVKKLQQEKISHSVFVQENAPTNPAVATVYNIEVEGAHTYFANGILVHNCDEELEVELYDELMLRLAASDGYFSMVFTATLGQEFWRETMEEIGTKLERFPDAKKMQITMYDCLHYEDGSPSHWSETRIQQIINRCKSHAEVLRRVFGRFVVDSGLKYPAFDRKKHFKSGHPLPKNWHIYGAVDIGSGGDNGHPSSIVFVAVSPDFRQGRVFRGWRGDGIQTTAADALMKFLELRGDLKLTGQFYDWGNKDFEVIATRMGEPFTKAEKSHDIGEDVVNVLFKNGFLYIHDDDPELQKLATELSTLLKSTPKNKAKDDFCDALRYCVTKIPWDWSAISGDLPESLKKDIPLSVDEKRRLGDSELEEQRAKELIEEELEAWNEQYEA